MKRSIPPRKPNPLADEEQRIGAIIRSLATSKDESGEFCNHDHVVEFARKLNVPYLVIEMAVDGWVTMDDIEELISNPAAMAACAKHRNLRRWDAE